MLLVFYNKYDFYKTIIYDTVELISFMILKQENGGRYDYSKK